MPDLTTIHTFTDHTVFESARHNANYAAVKGVVDSLDNDNIAAAAGIQESKILFDHANGHAHTGVAGGQVVAGTSVDKAVLATQGTVKFCSGSTPVVAGGNMVVNYTGLRTYSEIPMLFLFWDDAAGGNGMTTRGLGRFEEAGVMRGYFVYHVTNERFIIRNDFAVDLTFYWIAIGV